MMNDKISVVLPCFNAENYVGDAIKSILNQTYENLELIVINDGSTDSSLNIINYLSHSDGRIKVISRENKGLIYSLNEGIAASSGKYIARMDADDISLTTRLKDQFDYMSNNKLDLVGGGIVKFKDQSDSIEREKYYPETNAELTASILTLKSRIAHPTVLAKKEVFIKHCYDKQFLHAEDYALWLKIALTGKFRIGNYPEIVLRYRSHPAQVHTLNKQKQRDSKRFAFFTFMEPRSVKEQKMIRNIHDFWQIGRPMDKVRGMYWMRSWIQYLENKFNIDSAIKNAIYKRLLNQIF